MRTVQTLALQNKLALSNLPTRSYFPDNPKMLRFLMNLKNAIQNHGVSDTQVINHQLIHAMQTAEKLDLFYDYADCAHFRDANGVYGTSAKLHGFINRENHQPIDPAFLVSTDDELHDAQLALKEGQVLLVTKDCCVELSDYMLAGETVGYTGEKLPFQWTVGSETTWLGERGVGGQGGAILKFDTFTECCILIGPNARLSGLVIQGPDRPSDLKNADSNFSVGIVIKGDGAVIENCEISAFFRAGIHVVDSKNVKISNNYFHDISSPASGYAVLVENSQVEIKENLFSHVTSAAFVSDTSSVVFFENMDAGNMGGMYFVGSGKVYANYNTFLSSTDLCNLDGSVFADHNCFAYPRNIYASWATLNRLKNNIFDLNAPALYSGEGLISSNFKPLAKKGQDMNPLLCDLPWELPVLSRCYYDESNDMGYVLLKKLVCSANEDKEELIKLLTKTIAVIGGYANYLEYSDKDLVSFEVDGQRYGAYSDNDPIGGGVGYSRIVTTGDYIVTNEEELKKALEVAKSGDIIFMPSGTYINISDACENDVRTLSIPSGITLASDRGRILEDGSVSGGAIIATSALVSKFAFILMGENIRLTGFVLKGPDPSRHVRHHTRSFSDRTNKIRMKYYWGIPLANGVKCPYSGVEFDNLEICGFNNTGISIHNQDNPPRGIKVHHCYIHHCQIKGLGYGVCFSKGFAEITYNMFNYNRHSIAGSGLPDSGYIAENNIEMGENIDTYFDMHGGIDRKDGTTIAGSYIKMRNNSFLGSWRPFVLRGIPNDYLDYSFNVAASNGREKAYAMLFYENKLVENATVGSNIWDIQNSNRKPTQAMDSFVHEKE